MTFDEWFAETSKVTTFFHAGVCKSLAIAAWEAATKAEREACAKVCEETGKTKGNILRECYVCADAIRMRSDKG
jgi:hypothetical protein